MYISSHLIAHHMMRGLIAATLVVMALEFLTQGEIIQFNWSSGVLTNYYEKCSRMNRVAAVKAAHFTLR